MPWQRKWGFCEMCIIALLKLYDRRKCEEVRLWQRRFRTESTELKRCGSIDVNRGRFYPIIYWNKRDIYQYIKAKRLVLPQEYTEIGHSFRSLCGEDVLMVKHMFPNDYEKLLKLYPLAGAAAYREEMGNEK